MAKCPEHMLAKFAPPEAVLEKYPHHDRANQNFGLYCSGYTEDEIAAFVGVDIEEVKRDLIYVNHRLHAREIIKYNNDRTRILLQRQESENFRKMMKDSLATKVEDLVDAGISPAGIMKEFREAVGMVQKAEPMVQFNTQVNAGSAGTGNGITSTEDIIRRVLNQIDQESSPATEVQTNESDTVLEGDLISDTEDSDS